MTSRSFILTGEQIRAARAIARIGQAELAALCDLSLETIKRLEGIRGPVEANVRTIAAIVEAFDRKSVSLELGEDGRVGVRLASGPAAPTLSSDPVRSTASETERSAYRLIYYSRAAGPTLAAMESILSEIQDVSARRNAELGVTGMLMAQNGWFLGALEGDKVSGRFMEPFPGTPGTPTCRSCRLVPCGAGSSATGMSSAVCSVRTKTCSTTNPAWPAASMRRNCRPRPRSDCWPSLMILKANLRVRAGVAGAAARLANIASTWRVSRVSAAFRRAGEEGGQAIPAGSDNPANADRAPKVGFRADAATGVTPPLRPNPGGSAVPNRRRRRPAPTGSDWPPGPRIRPRPSHNPL